MLLAILKFLLRILFWLRLLNFLDIFVPFSALPIVFPRIILASIGYFCRSWRWPIESWLAFTSRPMRNLTRWYTNDPIFIVLFLSRFSLGVRPLLGWVWSYFSPAAVSRVDYLFYIAPWISAISKHIFYGFSFVLCLFSLSQLAFFLLIFTRWIIWYRNVERLNIRVRV